MPTYRVDHDGRWVGEFSTPCVMLFVMPEALQAAVDLVTAAGVVYLAVRMERFIGRVEGVERSLNAHVNTPGLHGGR